ncbi:MAG: histidinol dehydrogenase [Treponema sp.]|nr:histidinol dehydrogenase [Treponema sp.]
MKIIESNDFETYWKNYSKKVTDDPKTEKTVKKIINAVRKDGDKAVRKFASKFDKSSPQKLEVPVSEAKLALETLRTSDKPLVEALELAAKNIYNFSNKQREQFSDFETEIDIGLFTGQKIIPVQRAAVYIPGGRFPLFSSVLMCMIPAFCAGVEELILSSPPMENGLPDKRTLAAAAIAAQTCGISLDETNRCKLKIFAIGGAQAIAALALGTESVPRVDVITGPGSRFVAAAKRMLFGEVGIDFIAGPSDILVIADGKDSTNIEQTADLIAADMLAQAEHDPDARARALVPNREFADKIVAAMEKRLVNLPTAEIACASLKNGGLIIIYSNMEEAVSISNKIAPEHLELQIADADKWISRFKNYGSLFIGELSAEVLGDYSAGVNHTLPTETSARFTGGLSARHFLKTVTTLRCAKGDGFERARNAAEIIGRAEGLEGHALSAASRSESKKN